MTTQQLNSTALALLQLLYHETGDRNPLSMGQIEVQTGVSESQLRPHLEDLKEGGYIVEHEEGFYITGTGLHYGYSRWV